MKLNQENIPIVPISEPTMAEKEIMSFDYLRNNCSYKLLSQEFNSIYEPLLKQLGINSPAVMLFPKMAQTLGVAKVLGSAAAEKIVIAINQEILPDKDYARYLLEHECWEVYIKLKPGFNMNTIDTVDSRLSLLDRKRPAHRYSCYREFLLATKDGKEDEYLEWWKNFYQQDRDRVDQMSEVELAKLAPVYGSSADLKNEIKKFIDSNQSIKEWAHNKVKERPERELTIAEAS